MSRPLNQSKKFELEIRNRTNDTKSEIQDSMPARVFRSLSLRALDLSRISSLRVQQFHRQGLLDVRCDAPGPPSAAARPSRASCTAANRCSSRPARYEQVLARSLQAERFIRPRKPNRPRSSEPPGYGHRPSVGRNPPACTCSRSRPPNPRGPARNPLNRYVRPRLAHHIGPAGSCDATSAR